jgi:hypothetical protein
LKLYEHQNWKHCVIRKVKPERVKNPSMMTPTRRAVQVELSAET